MLQGWEGSETDGSEGARLGRGVTKTLSSASQSKQRSPMGVDGTDPFGGNGANPSCRRHFCWDLVGIFLIGYDLVMIPLEVFDSWTSDIAIFILVLTTSFWCVDFIRAFFLGYYVQGEVVLALRLIRRRYATTWMIPDATINVTDIIFLISMAMGATHTNVYATLHACRLLRTLKIPRLLGMIDDRINSEYHANILKIAKLFVFLIFLNHLIACCWYYVGWYFASFYGDSWIMALGERDLQYLYITAFHWSLTQFTPASISVQPRNHMERMVARKLG